MCSVPGSVAHDDEPYRALFESLHADRIGYFRHWTHDAPVVLSPERDQELHRVQQLLVRFARHYDSCYRDFLDVVPYDERVLQLLSWTDDRPHRLGTFRPDYLMCADGSLKVCEITSRFFGNAYFYSFFMDNTGRELAAEAGAIDVRSRIEPMLAHFARMAEGKSHVVVLKSADRSDSIPLYVPFYQALGLTVQVIEAADAHAFTADERTLVLSALNQTDLLRLPDDAIRRFVDADGRNDLRTMFLLHDKRTLALVHDDRFCAGCFDEEETAFLREHVVRTYIQGRDADVWADARAHRERYVLKHARLGKSEKVYAGKLCSERLWNDIFERPSFDTMILQPFVEQRRMRFPWRGYEVLEHVCGTILCLDDDYYGTGMFRASTCPIINLADDSKVGFVCTSQVDLFPKEYVL